jgi:hypothetical protein
MNGAFIKVKRFFPPWCIWATALYTLCLLPSLGSAPGGYALSTFCKFAPSIIVVAILATLINALFRSLKKRGLLPQQRPNYGLVSVTLEVICATSGSAFLLLLCMDCERQMLLVELTCLATLVASLMGLVPLRDDAD